MMTIHSQLLFLLLPPDVYIWLAALLLFLLSAGCYCWGHRLWRRCRRVPVVLLGLFVVACWYVLLYGTFVGIARLEVRQVEFASADLPAAFDGYRIVQFSDVHLGTYTGWRQSLLTRAVDSIKAQKGDMIVFTGDLQNSVPDEIQPYKALLSSMKAPDGVYTVLGNHDYAEYFNGTDFEKGANCGLTRTLEMEMGWILLANWRRIIRRGTDSLVVAGMENDGEGRFPQLGRTRNALYGLRRNSFVVMLEHDPTSWRRKILPHTHCQLTLSGHTHGGQFELFGWSPANLRYRESFGFYQAGSRAIYVSSGLGGVIPFRFGVPPEIVVITLRKK